MSATTGKLPLHVEPADRRAAGARGAAPRRRGAPSAVAGARLATAQARLETPLGPVLLAATARGLCGLWFDGQAHHPGVLEAPFDERHPVIAQAIAELGRYWRADAAPQANAGRAAADARPAMSFGVPLELAGTPFQRDVWSALRRIEPGRTVTYQELARLAGHPRAARAVGAAVGRNPVSIIVPCHRVVGCDGSLTGYAAGLDRKRALLDHEAGCPR